MTSLYERIKELFTFVPAKKYEYICLHCDKVFDGANIEIFIKHQIDEKHYDCTRRLK